MANHKKIASKSNRNNTDMLLFHLENCTRHSSELIYQLQLYWYIKQSALFSEKDVIINHDIIYTTQNTTHRTAITFDLQTIVTNTF